MVTGGAGAVGSLVGQIGKLKGLRVVALAGTDEKCRWMKDDLGFDVVINYKTANIDDALKVCEDLFKSKFVGWFFLFFKELGSRHHVVTRLNPSSLVQNAQPYLN